MTVTHYSGGGEGKSPKAGYRNRRWRVQKTVVGTNETSRTRRKNEVGRAYTVIKSLELVRTRDASV